MLLPLFRRYFKATGWTLEGQEFVEHRRCVVIAAPHTSNWDFVFTMAAFDLMNLPVRFTVKKELTGFPMGLIINPLGGIAIDRSPREGSPDRISAVDAMVDLFTTHPGDLAIAVSAEGTRGLRTRWKSGFYHVAVGANVPILLGYLDYGKKAAGIGGVVHPSGDYEADMRKIMAFYEAIEPKKPALFSVDQRFIDP